MPALRVTAPRVGPAALNQIARRVGLRVGLLRADDLPAAQELLYRVYFDELGWSPPQPNASNLRADHDARRFMDDFDDTAIWVGLFTARHTLIGVTRVIDPALSGGLEIARYVDLPVLSARVGEANRVALLPAWRRGPALALLSLAGAWAARRQGMDEVIGTSTARIFERHARHVGWTVIGPEFRYHPRDPEPVLPLRFDPRLPALTRVAAGMAVTQLRRRVWGGGRRQPSKA